MNCSQGRNLIYLYRPGELPESLQKDLENHLASCPSCSKAWHAARDVEKEVAALRRVEPSLEDGAGLTDSIMRSLESVEHRRTRTVGLLSRLGAAPVFRAAAILFLLLTGAALSLLSYRDARSLSTLEEQLTASHASVMQAGVFDMRDVRMLRPLVQSIPTIPDSLLAGILSQTSPDQSAGWFGRAEPMMKQSAWETSSIINDLVTRYPGLAKIRIDDGLDEHELTILASEGGAFLHDVQMLVRKGVDTHER